MDRPGADFVMCLATIRERLGANPVAIPGADLTRRPSFVGLVDMVAMVAVFYHGDDLGGDVLRKPIPDP